MTRTLGSSQTHHQISLQNATCRHSHSHGRNRIAELPIKEFNWKYSVYGNPKEDIPSDIPTPRGKRIVTTSFIDANLYHDLISGKSVTGILHFFNKTPIDWFSKLQSTVETATFGSEYVVARTCTEQIIDLGAHSDTSECPLKGQAICSATTRRLLILLRTHTESYRSDTALCPSTRLAMP